MEKPAACAKIISRRFATEPEGAFVSSDESASPTFDWNAVSTELTVDPHLQYPVATAPSASTLPFKFFVTTAAKDLARNSMVTSVHSQFTLLRKFKQVCVLYSAGSMDSGEAGTVASVGAGDDETLSPRQMRGFLTSDISSLPEGIIEFQRATIDTAIGKIVGDPFGLLGDMLIQSVSYEPPADQVAFDASPLLNLGIFVAATGHNAKGDAVSKNVVAAVNDD